MKLHTTETEVIRLLAAKHWPSDILAQEKCVAECINAGWTGSGPPRWLVQAMQDAAVETAREAHGKIHDEVRRRTEAMRRQCLDVLRTIAAQVDPAAPEAATFDSLLHDAIAHVEAADRPREPALAETFDMASAVLKKALASSSAVALEHAPELRQRIVATIDQFLTEAAVGQVNIQAV